MEDAVLTDGVVLLRPFTMADSDVLYASVRDSLTELCQWLPWAHPEYARADATGFIQMSRRWWDEQSQFTFGIFDAVNGAHVGSVGVNHLNMQHRYANIGYWVRTSYTRRGFCTRSLRLAARFAFDTLGLTRVEIAAEPENGASRGVAEKAGATFEVIARNRIVMRGQALPAAVYSLVPEDLRD
jgi:RimJ/RimL family protein N-acetyltransferase